MLFIEFTFPKKHILKLNCLAIFLVTLWKKKLLSMAKMLFAGSDSDARYQLLKFALA